MFWRRKRQQGELQRSLCADGVFSALPAEDVLAVHGELYRRLKVEMDFAPDDIATYYTDLVHKLAVYVHGLPASLHGQYRQSAGLLGKCLRTAFLSQRNAHGRVVAAHMPADARTVAERAWRYAAMIAGLLYPTGVLSRLGAKAEASRRLWRPEAGPLLEWLKSNGETAYRPYWSTRDWQHQSPGKVRLWIASRLISAPIHAFLVQETHQFVDQMLGVLADELSEDDLLMQVVLEAYDEAMRQELLSTLDEMRGLPIEDSGERLMQAVALAINDSCKEGEEPFLCRGEGVDYALWPRFAHAIRAAAARHDILGISDDDEDILDQLMEAGIIVPGENGEYLQYITVGRYNTSIPSRAVTLTDLNQFGVRPAQIHSCRATDVPAEQRKEEEDDVQGDLSMEGEGDVAENKVLQEEHAQIPEADSGNGGKKIRSRMARWRALGELGVLLSQASTTHGELGWWTEKGRALPWPEIAEQCGVRPSDFLRALNESGVGIASSRRKLPLIHNVMHEGQLRRAVIIDSAAWSCERDG